MTPFGPPSNAIHSRAHTPTPLTLLFVLLLNISSALVPYAAPRKLTSYSAFAYFRKASFFTLPTSFLSSFFLFTLLPLSAFRPCLYREQSRFLSTVFNASHTKRKTACSSSSCHLRKHISRTLSSISKLADQVSLAVLIRFAYRNTTQPKAPTYSSKTTQLSKVTLFYYAPQFTQVLVLFPRLSA